MKVAVIGAGAWGTALAVVSARGGNRVALWSHDADVAAQVEKHRESPYLPGVKIPENVTVATEMAETAGADVWLIVVPAEFFRETVRASRPFWHGQPIIICTKGMEAATGKFMSEVLDEELSEADGESPKYGVLSGPQFSGEVAAGIPTGSTLAGPPRVFDAGKIALPELYLESTDDTIGVQLCGTGKNAVAILAGFLEGEGRGENEKAMKITLAWNEIVTLGLKMQAKTETFLKLCGVGDLLLSATSKTSRNFSAGLKLARNESLGDITVEGIAAIKGLAARARALGVNLPILGAMARRLTA